ncbi:hypothetical protein AKJ16_DCAP11554 [Drosera capensis]
MRIATETVCRRDVAADWITVEMIDSVGSEV